MVDESSVPVSAILSVGVGERIGPTRRVVIVDWACSLAVSRGMVGLAPSVVLGCSKDVRFKGLSLMGIDFGWVLYIFSDTGGGLREYVESHVVIVR